MHWLQSIDAAVFRLGNQSLSNPLGDWLMPILSGHALFAPVLLLVLGWLLIRGGLRGRLCVLCLAGGLLVGDGLVSNSLKHTLQRPRPFQDMPDTRLLVGKSSNPSMPSAHALNSFAAAAIAGAFYRRSRRFLFPLAAGISFSRVYNGVHYPSDILVGALLGLATAWLVRRGLDAIWNTAGPRWFPIWHQKVPSLRLPASPTAHPPPEAPAPPPPDSAALLEAQWWRLGCLFLLTLLAGRLAFLAWGGFELSEDEAYQWVWSKHLDLSYYSKPPLIAYTQWLGTHLWGDSEFGIRFASPVIATILGFLTLRLFTRLVGARFAFGLLLVLTTTPLFGAGAVLMTIDPLSVLFWTAAMLAGWRAVQSGRAQDWLWTGLWTGLGFLSKYTALFQLLSWALFFVLHRPARRALRTPGPYLALLLLALATVPVLVWNHQHQWITLTHLTERGGLDRSWSFRPKFILEFLGAEWGLLNPVWFTLTLAAAWATGRRLFRVDPLRQFLFCMGAPLFLFYTAYTLRARVLPNWIAPAVLPLFFLTALHWRETWSAGRRWLRITFTTGVALGGLALAIFHAPVLLSKLGADRWLGGKDPLRRLHGWPETAAVVEAARARLAAEGAEAFIIGDHYGITGQLSFYLPEARAAIQRGGPALVYYVATQVPHNQFYFFPGYAERRGQNAIYAAIEDKPAPAPDFLRQQFTSVRDLGLHEIRRRNTTVRWLQLYECRGLR